MPEELVPLAVRIAVRNAIGGWGPYTARQIDELFQSHGFVDADSTVPDVGGVRRTAAEAYQVCIDFTSSELVRRYLMLVDEVLEAVPEDPASRDSPGQRLRRALRVAGIEHDASGRLVPPGTDAHAANALQDATDHLWTQDRIRIFISHTSRHRAEVAEVANELGRSTFSCFVAHDDIEPSQQWQDVIEQALRTCDVLMAWITDDFHGSRWTDQEVGWALGRELIVVPMKVEGDPYGFFGTYQALPVRSEQSLREVATAVAHTVAIAVFTEQRPDARRLLPKMTDLVVESFCTSRSFETTMRRFELLRRIPPSAWTQERAAAIRTAVETNRQISGCVLQLGRPTPAPDAIERLLSEHGR